jgi:hypothetical protein
VSGLATKYALNICKLKGGSARGVLTALAWRSAEESPSLVFLPQDKICDCTGVTENTVRAAIEKLVAAHELKVVKIGGVRPNGKREATDYELVGVRQWIAAGCPDRDKWQGAKAEPLGLNSCTLRPQNLHPSKGIITKSTNQHCLLQESEAPKTTHKEEANAPKQNPSLPLSERSEDSEAKAKFCGVRDAMVKLCAEGDLDAWLGALQHACDNAPTLRGRDVRSSWERCCEWRDEKGYRPPTRQDFAGWLLHEHPAAEEIAMNISRQPMATLRRNAEASHRKRIAMNISRQPMATAA